MQHYTSRTIKNLLGFLFLGFVFSAASRAASKTEIGIDVSASLEKFKEHVLAAEKFLEKAYSVEKLSELNDLLLI